MEEKMEDNQESKCSRCKAHFITNGKKTCLTCISKMSEQRKIRNQKLKAVETVETVETQLDEKISISESIFETISETVVETISETVVETSNEINNYDKEEALTNFDSKILISKDQTRGLEHPFSMKNYGMRGSGKTTWLINYLNSFHNDWNRFIIVAPTTGQDLWKKVEPKALDKIIFKSPEQVLELDPLILPNSIVIFDDCMVDLLNNKEMFEYANLLYINGRHPTSTRPGVSVISLEQTIMNPKLKIQRTNSTYFLINKVTDVKGLASIAEMVGVDLRHLIASTKHCWAKRKPVFVSVNYEHKLRQDFNKALIWKNNKLVVKDIKKQDQEENEWELTQEEQLIFNIIQNYKPPDYKIISKGTDIYKLPMIKDLLLDNLELYSNKFLNAMLKQKFIGFKQFGFFFDFGNIKRIYDYYGYENVYPDKKLYAKRLSQKDKDRLVRFNTLCAPIFAKREIKRLESLKEFTKLEKDRIENKYSDYFMNNAYPNYYKLPDLQSAETKLTLAKIDKLK